MCIQPVHYEHLSNIFHSIPLFLLKKMCAIHMNHGCCWEPARYGTSTIERLGSVVSSWLRMVTGRLRVSWLMCRDRRLLTHTKVARLEQCSRLRNGTVQTPSTDWNFRAYSIVILSLSSFPAQHTAPYGQISSTVVILYGEWSSSFNHWRILQRALKLRFKGHHLLIV